MADIVEVLSDNLVEIILQGKKVKASKLTLGIFAKFSDYCNLVNRKEIAESAKLLYGGKIPKEIWRDIRKPISDDNVVTFAEQHLDCLSYLLTMLIKQANPDMAEEQINSMITIEAVGDITNALLGDLQTNPTRTMPEKQEIKP